MRLGRVEVVGDSMRPALQPGDWWVVRWGGRPAGTGSVVVARRPDRSDLLIVKRVARREDGRVWLAGDNPTASDDSRLFGWVPDADVLGVLLFRYRRGELNRGAEPGS